jgi:quercetin dioxygenase-like cupin family protein
MRTRSKLAISLGVLGVSAALAAAHAQAPHQHISCKPIAERTGDLGCWIAARDVLRELPPGPLYWHLDTYPSRAAAEAAKGPRGTVIESGGKVWLFTIAREDWRGGGEHVARVGPLPLGNAEQYAAVYLETVLPPGFSAPIHRHAGPEAVFPIAGELCVETPQGRNIERPGGETHVIAGGQPMALTVTGNEPHRSLVLILHDASKPFAIPAPDWTPKGLCKS